MYKRYLISASWLLSEQVARLASSLLIGILIARHLGPTGLGQLSYAQSVVGILGVFATLGFEGIVIKELINDPNRRNEIMGSAFYTMLIAGILVGILLIISSPWIAPSSVEQYLIIITAVALPLQAFSVVSYDHQARSALGPVSRAQLTQLLFSSLLRAALVITGCSVIAFGYAGIADAMILAALLLFVAVSGQLSPRKWRFNWDVSKYLLLKSWPLIFTGLLVTLFVKIDQIMLRNLVSAEAVGEYAVAVRLTGVLVILPMMVVKAVNPAIIAAQAGDQSLYESRMQLLYDLGVVLSASAAMVFTFLAAPLIHLLFGAQYAGASGVAVIFVWCSVWITVGQINAVAIIATGDTYQTLLKALMGVVVNVILNYMFISRYGITGAATATLISYVVSTYVMMLVLPGQRRQFLLATRSLIIHNALIRLVKYAKHYRQPR